MIYTQLGPTPLEVSKICLGTMTWGEQNTEAEGHAQMDYAVERGINFFDTAEMYSVPANAKTQGSTERIIGTWFKKTGKRKDIVLATKIAGPLPMAEHIRENLQYTPETIAASVDKSLQRLQTDYIDLYQLHWPARSTNFFGKRGFDKIRGDWEDDFHQILEGMQAMVESGKVRYFGVSNETPWGLMHFLQLSEKYGLPRCVSIQNPYSLLNRTFEVGLSEVCLREQVACLPYSPLAFGVLSGKYVKGTDTPKSRINLFPRFSRYIGPVATEATKKYLEIAERHGMTLAQMSLAFVNQRSFVTSNIIGATSLEQLKENIDSIDIELSKEILKEIEAVHEAIPNPAP